MTKQEKIEVLERAIPLIISDNPFPYGICRAIYTALIDTDFATTAVHWDEHAQEFLSGVGIELPMPHYGLADSAAHCYCWPLTPEGDEERRAFLRKHIERLRKELENEKQ